MIQIHYIIIIYHFIRRLKYIIFNHYTTLIVYFNINKKKKNLIGDFYNIINTKSAARFMYLTRYYYYVLVFLR